MTPANQNPVIVTGCHRGGTTWVGDTIASHESLTYIGEPLNKHYPSPGRTLYAAPVWYPFQPAGSPNKMLERQYTHTLHNRVDLKNYFDTRMRKVRPSALRTPRLLLSASRGFWREWSESRGKTACIKDPFSLLHSAWLATTFPNCRIVIMVRHPAAFAFSLQKKNWEFPFEDLLVQEALMETVPHLRGKIEDFSRTRRDILEQASLLWGLLYTYVCALPSLENILIVKYEAIAEDPKTEFMRIFSWLGLEMSEKTLNKITADTSGVDRRENGRIASRDSRLNAWSWKNHITIEEEKLILRHCKAPVANLYPNTP